MGPSDPFRHADVTERPIPPRAPAGSAEPLRPLRPLRPVMGFVVGAGVAASVLHFGVFHSAIVLAAGGAGWLVFGIVSGHLDVRGAAAALLRR